MDLPAVSSALTQQPTSLLGVDDRAHGLPEIGAKFPYMEWVVWERSFMSKERDEELAEKSSDFLEENKCLVILDDIWSTEAWDISKHQHLQQRRLIASSCSPLETRE
ncbi:hypothetical protein V6N13_142652 [Hibiscus sabdariffa]